MHLNELGEIINVNGEKACQFHGSNSSSFWAGCSAMRPRTSASQACGSISFILAVTIRLYITAARSPPRSEPQNHHALGGIVRQADAAIVKEAGKCAPELEHVVHGLGDIVCCARVWRAARASSRLLKNSAVFASVA